MGLQFCSPGWAFCNGQLLPISQNTALFSLLGTTYGGDGRTTVGLPDFRGRGPLHPGRGPGLSTYSLGQKGGAATATLTVNQIPSHRHQVMANETEGDKPSPVNNAWAIPGADRDLSYYNSAAGTAAMAATALNNTGGSQAHNNLMPYLTVNFCIALVGVYPIRS